MKQFQVYLWVEGKNLGRFDMVRKGLSCYLVIAMFVIGVAPRVDAAFSPSEMVRIDASVRTGDLEKVRTLLEQKVVQQRLKDLGYAPDEISTRLSDLSDQQLHSIASRIDDLRVGGDGLGVVIALLVIAILVIVIIMLMGKKVVIK
jgi:hypothetical protein